MHCLLHPGAFTAARFPHLDKAAGWILCLTGPEITYEPFLEAFLERYGDRNGFACSSAASGKNVRKNPRFYPELFRQRGPLMGLQAHAGLWSVSCPRNDQAAKHDKCRISATLKPIEGAEFSNAFALFYSPFKRRGTLNDLPDPNACITYRFRHIFGYALRCRAIPDGGSCLFFSGRSGALQPLFPGGAKRPLSLEEALERFST